MRAAVARKLILVTEPIVNPGRCTVKGPCRPAPTATSPRCVIAADDHSPPDRTATPEIRRLNTYDITKADTTGFRDASGNQVTQDRLDKQQTVVAEARPQEDEDG